MGNAGLRGVELYSHADPPHRLARSEAWQHYGYAQRRGETDRFWHSPPRRSQQKDEHGEPGDDLLCIPRTSGLDYRSWVPTLVPKPEGANPGWSTSGYLFP